MLSLFFAAKACFQASKPIILKLNMVLRANKAGHYSVTSLEQVVAALEALRETMISRLAEAEAEVRRAGLRVVDAEIN